jgi:peptidoglycan hydrolase-like protein with peptidoglycan-binding domain
MYSGMPVLKIGSTGAAVRELQTKLQTLRYDIGAAGADGSFGPSTETAVKKFQSQNGLTADGIVGSATWAALEKATGKPAVGSSVVVATQTSELIGGGLNVYRTELIDAAGKLVNTVRCVSGRVGKQTPSDVTGSQTPLPFGVYTFDTPGSVTDAGGEFGGVWSAVTPTFTTGRGNIGIHHDPSAFKQNAATGTAGCLATPTVEERNIMTTFIQTYKPTKLIVKKKGL